MTEEKSLKDELKEIKSLLEESDKKKVKKPKEFKIPTIAKINKAKIKKNWVTVIEIGENRNLTFTKHQIQDQTIIVDGVPRLATADNILIYKNKPVLIIPRYSVKPLSPSDNLFLNISENWKENESKGLNIKGYKVLLDRMKRDALLNKKAMPWWIWIVGLVIVGVAFYILSSQ